jgi:hypothetical protein
MEIKVNLVDEEEDTKVEEGGSEETEKKKKFVKKPYMVSIYCRG